MLCSEANKKEIEAAIKWCRENNFLPFDCRWVEEKQFYEVEIANLPVVRSAISLEYAINAAKIYTKKYAESGRLEMMQKAARERRLAS